MHSIQINNLISNPIIKSDVIDYSGKVRILVYNFDTTNQEINANDEVLLVYVPSNQVRIIGVYHYCDHLSYESSYRFGFNIGKKTNSYHDLLMDNTEEFASITQATTSTSALTNQFCGVNKSYQSQYGYYITMSSNLVIPDTHKMHGYILYVAD